jgi:phosphoglycerol transferase MdoB-like AlkP superfamily enzyme
VTPLARVAAQEPERAALAVVLLVVIHPAALARRAAARAPRATLAPRRAALEAALAAVLSAVAVLSACAHLRNRRVIRGRTNIYPLRRLLMRRWRLRRC